MAIDEALAEAQRLGFLGPASIASHGATRKRFVAASAAGSIDSRPGHRRGPARPGHRRRPAQSRPSSCSTLGERRTDFLRRAVSRLAWSGPRRRADRPGRGPGARSDWRATCAAVVARGFGPPGPRPSVPPPSSLRGASSWSASRRRRREDEANRWPQGRSAELGLKPTTTSPAPRCDHSRSSPAVPTALPARPLGTRRCSERCFTWNRRASPTSMTTHVPRETGAPRCALGFTGSSRATVCRVRVLDLVEPLGKDVPSLPPT